MAYDSRVYRILIASPSDVEEEREIAVRVIQEWNDLYSHSRKIVLLPLRWETHTAPEYGTRPQEVINRAIVDECDLLVGVFWTRIGSPTGSADSGTLEEIERVGSAEKPVMLYFSRVAIDPETIDMAQNEKLKEFKSKTYPKGLVENYKSIIEFRDKFAKQLELRIRDLQRADSTDERPLSIDFYSPEQDDFVGQSTDIKIDHPSVKDFSSVDEERQDEIKEAALEKVKSATKFPLALAVRNMSSSGIRNVYFELEISSDCKDVRVSETEFSNSGFPRSLFMHSSRRSGRNIGFGKNSKIAMFETDQLQTHDDGWKLSVEWEAIQPQRIRLLKPMLYIYSPESTKVEIKVRMLAESFPEPYEFKLEMNIVVKNREVDLESFLPDWREMLEDDVEF